VSNDIIKIVKEEENKSKEEKEMAWYNVDEKVKELAELKGIEEREIAEDIDLTELDGEWWATNRSKQNTVISRLDNLKNEITRAEKRKEAKASFHWVKDEEGWAVAGDFTGKKMGDSITVVRVDGTKQLKEIRRFSNIGNAYVE
jgi:hypothetical protein